MSEKFDPAPLDKHADKDVGKRSRAKHAGDELEQGLKDSFPASDPASSTQPKQAPK